MNQRKTAYVAGATGYTGRYVVEELLKRGVRVVAHVRPNSASRETWAQRFSGIGATVDFTPWEAAQMRATLERVQPTHVFSLLGTTLARPRRDPSGKSDYMSVDYALTRMTLEASSALPTPPVFVFLSSLSANSRSRNEYLKVRGLLEDAVRESGLPAILVRPAIITGADRGESRFTERAAAVASNTLLSLIGALGGARLRDRYLSMTGRELAAGIVRFALSPDAEGGAAVITYGDIRERLDFGHTSP